MTIIGGSLARPHLAFSASLAMGCCPTNRCRGRYHPVMQAKLVGAFDASNNLTAIHIRLSGYSILASGFPQNLQNGRSGSLPGPGARQRRTASATPPRTCSSTTPCATRTSFRASGAAAPAVLNAYFRATGRRIRLFPAKNHKIQMT
jgi:hypothetical protein